MDSLLDLTVGALRERPALAGIQAKPSWRDRAAFAAWVGLAAAPGIAALILAVALLR